jgi:hypothetical protein
MTGASPTRAQQSLERSPQGSRTVFVTSGPVSPLHQALARLDRMRRNELQAEARRLRVKVMIPWPGPMRSGRCSGRTCEPSFQARCFEMSLGTGSGALLGAGLGGLASYGINSLTGAQPQKKLSQSQLGQLRGGVAAGGLTTKNIDENRVVQVNTSPERQQLVNNLAQLFRGTANELGLLRGKLTPGFGALTEARRAALQAAERSQIGDLRTNLARRRVLGSSFSNDAEAAVREAFGRQQAEADAQSFLEELDADTKLLSAQTGTAQQANSMS